MADDDMIHRIALNKGQMLEERTNNNIRCHQSHNLGEGKSQDQPKTPRASRWFNLLYFYRLEDDF